jgi:hypothetical protein
MDYNNFDKIYNYLKSHQYDNLEKFDSNEVDVVIKLKFNGIIPDKYKKYNLVERRDGQSYFRESIIRRDSFCILSNKHDSICQAAHILDFKDSNNQEKYDISNGILLSNDLHKAFDNNYFTFNHNTCEVEIMYNNIKKKNIDIKDLYITQYEGTYIKQLDNCESKKYLFKRNNQI